MFDLQGYLIERQRQVESWLEASMPAETTPPAVLHQAMRYSVFSGGKRLRPVLCMAAAEAVGARTDAARLPAVAVELLHTYTLVHDDLPCMDDDELRRGKPTCHIAFGEANAVLAGDALQTLAFEVLAQAQPPSRYPPAQLIAELAAAAGSRGVVGGQVEDLAASERGGVSLEHVEFIHEHKTADLFRASLRMGAIAGDATAADLRDLSDYGACIGRAFQVVDDLIDAADDSATDAPCTAQPRNPERGSLTCLSVLTKGKARNLAVRLIGDAKRAVASFPPARVEPLLALADFVLSRAPGP